MSEVKIFRGHEGKSEDNFTVVQIGDLTLWFSYETIVAFQDGIFNEKFVCENVWGTTTGKHLNYIDDGNKESRVKRDHFVDALNKVINKFNEFSEA